MKNKLIIVIAIVVAFCLGYFSKSILTYYTTNKNNTTIPSKEIITKKVTGIGGIFFKCKDPEKVKEWYKAHLGINCDQYGFNFEWFENADSSKIGSTQWSPFAETESYFEPSTKEFMINYRVENLTNLVEQLKKENVTILDSIVTYEYGKFIHIMDIEFNKIELWEPDFNYVEEK